MLIRRDQIFTDDYAYDAAVNFQKSSEYKLANIKNFSEHDFRYQSGGAWWNDDGTISWVMLANHYYTLKPIEETTGK